MVIFNHNFVFQDEPEIQETLVANKSLTTVYVVESDEFSLSDKFPLVSSWVPMSGQEVRYYSADLFKKADSSFSWALEIKDVLTLIWDAAEEKILYIKGKHYTSDRLRFWIFHTFFPLVLELRREYRILHVGSVEIAGKPVLFSAFSFGGKSTLTDHFIQKGHRMLSDDSLAIDKRGDTYYTIASYPFHRPYREPETLGYPVKNFAIEPKPLHAVYLLKKSEPGAAIDIRELKGIEKFKAFHYSAFIDFSFMKEERFDFFTRMAKYVRVYEISVPWDLERLDEVYEKICRHSTSI